MTLDELEELLTNHGSEPTAWPIDSRQSALRFVARNTQAQRLLEQYSNGENTLDRLLDRLASQQPMPEFPGLEARVLQQPLPRKSRRMTDRLLDWLIPEPGFSGLQLWRPAMAACLPLLFGVLLSNVFSFGIDTSLDGFDNWDDELYLLSLNDYIETTL